MLPWMASSSATALMLLKMQMQPKRRMVETKANMNQISTSQPSLLKAITGTLHSAKRKKEREKMMNYSVRTH